METLVKPEVQLVEWFNEHWYKVIRNGETDFYASTTTKLGIMDKPNIARWRGDLGNREADLRMYEAGQRGTRIHWAWATALEGGAVIYDPWQRPIYTKEQIADLESRYKKVAILRTQDEMFQVVKLQKQFNILKPEVLAVELTVVDHNQRDAGTIDAIYKIKAGSYMIAGAKPLVLEGGIYINDLKTGNYVDDNTWLQLSDYGFMAKHSIGLDIAGALITHTSAKTKGGIAGLTTLFRPAETLLGIDYTDFRHAAALWDREHAEDRPEEYQFPSLVTLGGHS
jgi:hypothetical protein